MILLGFGSHPPPITLWGRLQCPRPPLRETSPDTWVAASPRGSRGRFVIAVGPPRGRSRPPPKFVVPGGRGFVIAPSSPPGDPDRHLVAPSPRDGVRHRDCPVFLRQAILIAARVAPSSGAAGTAERRLDRCHEFPPDRFGSPTGSRSGRGGRRISLFAKKTHSVASPRAAPVYFFLCSTPFRFFPRSVVFAFGLFRFFSRSEVSPFPFFRVAVSSPLERDACSCSSLRLFRLFSLSELSTFSFFPTRAWTKRGCLLVTRIRARKTPSLDRRSSTGRRAPSREELRR